MAIVELKLDIKDAAYVAANPTLVLSDGEPIFLDDGTFAFGDGSTQLSGLTFHGGGGSWGQITGTLSDQTDLQAELDNKQDRVSSVTPGTGIITVGDYDSGGTDNDIRVTASTYYIEGSGSYSAIQTDFNNIANCASGNFKYIDIFGLTDGTVTSLEGAEGTAAVHPTQPANSVRIGYVLWGSGGAVSVSAPTSTGYSISFTGYYAFSPADSTTYAIGGTGLNPSAPQPSNRGVMLIPIAFTGTIKTVMFNCTSSVAGSAATDLTTFNLVVVDDTSLPSSQIGSTSAGIISTTTIANDVNINDAYRVVAVNIAVVAGQRLRIEMVTPVYTSNPTSCTSGWTIGIEI